MKNNPLLKGTIIKTVFAGLEVILLFGILLYSFFAARDGIWGYWGSIIALISLLSPIYVYAISNAIFTVNNLIIVTRNRHTSDSIKKYHKLSKRYLIWGVITGGVYGLPLIFFLENIFLFLAYRKEIEKIKSTEPF